MITPEDEQRSLSRRPRRALPSLQRRRLRRVIYSESHDEVANGKARVPQEVNPNGSEGLVRPEALDAGAALVFTAPGIPMLFQGQEFLEGDWFRDTVPVDWDQRDEFRGIVRLYRDLIRLRLNRDGFTRGLCGQFTQVYHLHDERKLLAFRRWDDGGPGDDVVVVANFRNEPQDGYVIGFPAEGPGSCASTATGRVTAQLSKVIGAQTWSPNRASTTVAPSAARFPSARTAC